MARRALFSVSDKNGVVEFAAGLVKLGWEIIATGGTQKLLESNGIRFDAVVAIEIPDERIVARMGGRRVCESFSIALGRLLISYTALNGSTIWK